MAVKAWGQLYIGADPPAEDPVIVGSVWVDTANGLIKRCSSVEPYTWVTVGGGEAGAHAETHQHGGDDEVATATPGANVIPKAGADGKLSAGFLQEVLSHADLTDAPEAAHHALVTLAGGCAPELTLDGQELLLAAVMTPTEHTAIGDGAPHHARYTDAEALTQGEAAVTSHEGEEDPHAQYQKESEKDAENGYAGLDANGLVPEARVHGNIARDSEVADAITTHEEAEDPHPVYQTPAEHAAIGDGAPHHAKYTDAEALVQGEAAVGTHVGLDDPHEQYQKEAEKDAVIGYIPDWGDFVRKLVYEERYHVYPFDISGAWTTVLVGAGAAVRYLEQHIIDISTSVAANRSVILRTGIMAGWQMDVDRATIDWGKPLALSILVTACEGSANGERRITFGKHHNCGIGDPTDKAIGFRFGERGGAPNYLTPVTGFVHDGDDLDTVALGNVNGYSTYKYLLVSDGAGNIDFYINGVLIDSLATGPSGMGTTYFCKFQMEVANNADSAHNILEMHDGRLLFDNGA